MWCQVSVADGQSSNVGKVDPLPNTPSFNDADDRAHARLEQQQTGQYRPGHAQALDQRGEVRGPYRPRVSFSHFSVPRSFLASVGSYGVRRRGVPALHERQAADRIGRGKNDVQDAAYERLAGAARQGRQAQAQEEDKGPKCHDVHRRAVARGRDPASEHQGRRQTHRDEKRQRVAKQDQVVGDPCRHAGDEVAEDQAKCRRFSLLTVGLSQQRDDDDQHNDRSLRGVEDEPGQKRHQDECIEQRIARRRDGPIQ